MKEALPDWLAKWCDRVPGLVPYGANAWKLGGDAEVSYPAGGHASMAQIEEDSYWFAHRNRVIASTVSRFRPDGPLFDVGGGNGFVSVGLRASGIEGVVIEPGATGAANARARGLPVINAPYEALDVPARSVPAVGIFDVLEHIPDPPAALDALHAALVPGGRLFIAVPAYEALWSGEDIYAGHYRRYTRETLTKLLGLHGYDVEYTTYFFGFLVLPVLLLRALPFRIGMGRGSADDASSDHRLPAGVIGRLMRASFDREARIIAEGGSVGFGTSCLAVACKI
jgi:SAM-dependent methyltransferase